MVFCLFVFLILVHLWNQHCITLFPYRNLCASSLNSSLTWVILEGHVVVLYSKASGTCLLKFFPFFVILHVLLLKGIEWYSVPIFISKWRKNLFRASMIRNSHLQMTLSTMVQTTILLSAVWSTKLFVIYSFKL